MRLTGLFEMNAARTLDSARVLFRSSGTTPYRFEFAVAMVQNCHFSARPKQVGPRNRQQGMCHVCVGPRRVKCVPRFPKDAVTYGMPAHDYHAVRRSLLSPCVYKRHFYAVNLALRKLAASCSLAKDHPTIDRRGRRKIVCSPCAFWWHISPISGMAESCHTNDVKNRVLLPEKWAKTSVVGVLQHLHNQKRLNPERTGESPIYAVRTTS